MNTEDPTRFQAVKEVYLEIIPQLEAIAKERMPFPSTGLRPAAGMVGMFLFIPLLWGINDLFFKGITVPNVLGTAIPASLLLVCILLWRDTVKKIEKAVDFRVAMRKMAYFDLRLHAGTIAFSDPKKSIRGFVSTLKTNEMEGRAVLLCARFAAVQAFSKKELENIPRSALEENNLRHMPAEDIPQTLKKLGILEGHIEEELAAIQEFNAVETERKYGVPAGTLLEKTP